MLALTAYIVSIPIVLALAAMVIWVSIEWAYSARLEFNALLDEGHSVIRAAGLAAIAPIVEFHREGMERRRVADLRRVNERNRAKAHHPSGEPLHSQPLRVVNGL